MVRTLCMFLFLLAAISSIRAQEQTGEQRITENGKTYILYRVKSGETLYSIAKRYHVSLSLLTGINPQVTDGLRTGETLKIPADGEQSVGTHYPDQKNPVRYIAHKVQRKETLYYLSKHYGVSIDDILTHNPGMTQLKKGVTIRIPQWESSKGVSGKIAQPAAGEILHTVEPGETLYSISRKYGIPVTGILERNPEARELKAGMKLVLISGPSVAQNSAGAPETCQLHIIVAGETIYSISKKYQVSADRLVELNPFLETRTPRPGDTLYIAQTEKTGVPEDARVNETDQFSKGKTPDCLPRARAGTETRSYRVALLIPVMLNANRSLNGELLKKVENDSEQGWVDTDTIRINRKPVNQVQFQGNSENYIHFYEGALLAVDSLQQAGIKIQLDVYDTEQKSFRSRNLISSGNLREADLIIGPVYPNEQKEVFEFAAKYKIPVVSPLSSSDEHTRDNPYAFQINPSKEFIAARTDRYLVSAYRNSHIVVLQTSPSGNEADNEVAKLRELMSKNDGSTGTASITVCNFRKDGYAGLREKMDKTRKNIVIIPSGNEAEVSVAVSNMKSLVTDYDITLLGNSRFAQFESINPDHFHQGQLEFLTPYWPDMTEPVTRSFVNKFRSYFKADPNQYSMQGHDVTFFFVKALHDYGDDFRDCISSEKAQLVQGNYHFIKRSSGGYLNTGLSVVQYLPSYSIIRKKVVSD